MKEHIKACHTHLNNRMALKRTALAYAMGTASETEMDKAITKVEDSTVVIMKTEVQHGLGST